MNNFISGCVHNIKNVWNLVMYILPAHDTVVNGNIFLEDSKKQSKGNIFMSFI